MLTHINDRGQPTMVDVSKKSVTTRTAVAESLVFLPDGIIAQLSQGQELVSPKGPVFQTAIVAGIMAVKKTSELIPMCHPLPIEKCDIKLEINGPTEVRISCLVRTTHKTGVEMEALTGASVAALTLYDMCKALSHAIEIKCTRLVAKTGGKSDYGQP